MPAKCKTVSYIKGSVVSENIARSLFVGITTGNLQNRLITTVCKIKHTI